MSDVGTKVPRLRHKVSALLVGIALAVGGIAGAAYAAVGTRNIGGSITHVYTISRHGTSSTSDTPFVNLAGSGMTVTVPAGERALVIARFTAESTCSGGAFVGCSVRIMADATEMNPAGGLPFAFDASGSGGGVSDSSEAHAMERDIVLGPGAHVIKVQMATQAPTTSFFLADWHLTVETSKA